MHTFTDTKRIRYSTFQAQMVKPANYRCSSHLAINIAVHFGVMSLTSIYFSMCYLLSFYLCVIRPRLLLSVSR